MKKTTIILLAVTLFLLCVSLVGCGWLFGTPDNSDNLGGNGGNGDEKYDLADLSVSLETLSFEYTSQPITPTVSLKYRGQEVAKVGLSTPHDDLTVEYLNNVEIGDATVIITAKSGSKKFSGSVQTDFRIKGIVDTVSVTDFSSLKGILNQGIHVNVSLDADVEIPSDEQIVIAAITTLDMNGHSLVNRGELTNHGTIRVSGSSYTPNLINYGKLINDSQKNSAILLDGGAALINHGQYSGDGVIGHVLALGNCKIYSDHKGETFNIVDNRIDVIYRNDINDENYVLDQVEYDYSGEQRNPVLMWTNGTSSSAVKNTNYTVTYSDNVNSGKATATFTATERSNYFYGTRTFEFTINKSVAQVSTVEQLQAALSNDNYCGVTLTSSGTVSLGDLSVPANVQVTLPKSVVDGNVALAQGAVLKLSGPASIRGNVTLAQGTIMELSDDTIRGNVALAQDATLKLNGKTLVYGSVTGAGRLQVESDAELYFSSSASVPAVAIVNDGAIYANFALSGIAGNGAVTQRKQLPSADIVVQDLRYNGSLQTPNISFANKDESIYSITYKRGQNDEATWTSTRFAERGNYQARVEFSEYDKCYYGNAAFEYAIVRGTATVSNQTALNDAIASDNYDSYVANDLTIASSQLFTVPQGITVTADSVSNNGELIVYGNLVVSSSVKNNGDARVTVGANGKLTCEVLNNLTPQVEITVQNGGICEVSSVAYFCDDNNDAVTGECDRYVRQDIANATFVNVVGGIYGVSMIPKFSLSLDGNVVSNISSECNAVYQNNKYRTSGETALMILTASDMSKTFYGVTRYNYAIAGGTTGANTQKSLAAALSDVSPEGLCNYEKVTVSSAIEFSNSQNLSYDMRVRQGCTLVIAAPITWAYKERNKSRYTFGNEGKIELRHTGTLPEYGTTHTWDGDITAYVSDANDLINAANCHIGHIIVEKIIYAVAWQDEIEIVAERNDITLELNRNSLEVKLVLKYYNGHTVTMSNGYVNNLTTTHGTANDKVGKVILNNIKCAFYEQDANTNVEKNSFEIII